jgi:hypothetical protein
VRFLGAGRVEQRSNGGCWAQGVRRRQSTNRGVRERSVGDFSGGLESAEGKRKQEMLSRGAKYKLVIYLVSVIVALPSVSVMVVETPAALL